MLQTCFAAQPALVELAEEVVARGKVIEQQHAEIERLKAEIERLTAAAPETEE